MTNITSRQDFHWQDISKLSDSELQKEINEHSDTIIEQLSNDLLTQETSIPRDLACRVIHCMTQTNAITDSNLTTFFSALKNSDALEDTITQFPEESYTSGFFSGVRSALSYLHLTKLSLTDTYEGLTKDETIVKLYTEALRNNNEALAIKLLNLIGDLKKSPIDWQTCLIDNSKQNLIPYENLLLHLIEKGADLDATNRKGEHILKLAAQQGFDKVVTTLIDKGISPNQLDKIRFAARVEDEAVIRVEKKSTKVTPLHVAAVKGHNKVVSILIEKGADIDAKNYKGETPLHLAAEHGHKQTVIDLIDKGADINARTNEGKTPLQQAAAKGNKEITLTLIENGAKVKPLLNESANFLKPVIIEIGKDYGFTENQLSFLNEFKDYDSFKNCILSNLDSLVSQENGNPLIFGLLLDDSAFFSRVAELTTKSQFTKWQSEISQKLNYKVLENLFFDVNISHYSKLLDTLEIPDPPEGVDLNVLVPLFDHINFTKPNEKPYRNPNKLTDEGVSVKPEALKKGLQDLLERVEKRTPFLGTPPAGTQELEDYYIKFDKLLKHITFYINKMDPDEQASALIDLAIMGRHCGGKIGEAQSMYRILSGLPFEKFDDLLYAGLQDRRLGIIMEWSSKFPESYQVHSYNQFMYFLGDNLGLPNAKMFDKPDNLASSEITLETSWKNFYETYTVAKLVEFVHEQLESNYKDPKKQSFVTEWLKDHTPLHFKKDEYGAIFTKIEQMEKQGMSRPEIRRALMDEYEDLYFSPDQSPENAVATHRSDAYFQAKDTGDAETAEQWNPEFYEPILKELEDGKYSRKEVEDLLLSKNIPIVRARNFKNLVEHERQMEYLNSALETDENGKVTGITREAARNVAVELEIIENRVNP